MGVPIDGRILRARATRSGTTRLALTLAFVGVSATACDSNTDPTDAIATIVVTPNPATTPARGTQQFSAEGRDADNNVVAISPIWFTRGGGSISSTGLFTAGGVAGTYVDAVAATSGGVADTVTVVVTAGPVATIVVSPNPAIMAVNGVQQFSAVARDADDNLVETPPVWSVIAGGSISGTGLFTTNATGPIYPKVVVATIGSVADSATVILVSLPAAPENAEATGISSSEILITWDDVSDNEDRFAIQRWIGGAWTNLSQTDPDVETFTHSGLSPNAVYEYRIRACNLAGCRNTGSVFGTTLP